MLALILLLVACRGEDELPLAAPESPAPAGGAAAPAGAPQARFLPSPVPEGAGTLRLAPPPLLREVGDREERVGEGWASRDGRRAVAVASGPTPETYALAVLDASLQELGVIPFGGYPDAGWAMPRWSPDGRYLATAQPVGDVRTVQVFDADARVLLDNLRGAKDFRWAPDQPLLVLNCWPDPESTVLAPVFKFYRPASRELISPIAETEQVGFVFEEFLASGEIAYRELRLSGSGDGEVWDPVGERRGRISADQLQVLSR